MTAALTSHPCLSTTVGMSPMSAVVGSRPSVSPVCMMTTTHQPVSTLMQAELDASPVISREMQSMLFASMRKA